MIIKEVSIFQDNSFFLEEITESQIIAESYSIIISDIQNWSSFRESLYIINEGIVDFIVKIFQKIIDIITACWEKIKNFFSKFSDSSTDRIKEKSSKMFPAVVDSDKKDNKISIDKNILEYIKSSDQLINDDIHKIIQEVNDMKGTDFVSVYENNVEKPLLEDKSKNKNDDDSDKEPNIVSIVRNKLSNVYDNFKDYIKSYNKSTFGDEMINYELIESKVLGNTDNETVEVELTDDLKSKIKEAYTKKIPQDINAIEKLKNFMQEKKSKYIQSANAVKKKIDSINDNIAAKVATEIARFSSQIINDHFSYMNMIMAGCAKVVTKVINKIEAIAGIK